MLNCVNFKTISDGEDLFLAINTGLNKKSYSRLNKTGNKSFYGFLWNGKKLKKLEYKSVFNIGEKVHLLGDHHNIIPLLDYINKNNDLKIIYQLAGMFNALEVSGEVLNLLTAETIFVNEEMDIVVLPEFLGSLMAFRGSSKDQIDKIDVYNHPDYSGARKIIFFLGIILYKGLTGTFPFYDNRKDYLKQKMRNSYYLSLDKGIYGLTFGITDVIHKSLTDKIQSLPEFLSLFNSYENYRRMTPEAKSVFKNNLTNFNRSIQRKIYIKNNILKFAGGLLFTGLLLFSIVFSSKKEDKLQSTSGFSQEKVIQSYFHSFNNLDVSLNMECVSDNVKRKDSDEILVQAISNGALEMDGHIGVLNPEKWSESEEKDAVVYGVSDVKVTNIGDNAYMVNYQKWTTESKHGESVLDSYYVVEKSEIEEVYLLKMIDGIWKIDSIKVISEVVETL